MTKKEKWELRLYIAGQTPKSVLALKNIVKYCKEHLEDQYSLEENVKKFYGGILHDLAFYSRVGTRKDTMVGGLRED